MTTLYISDLDGTLLRNDASLSAASRATLAQLISDGLSFSVASARSVSSMRPILQGLGLKLPVVEFNGAFLSDLETGRHEVVNALASGLAQEVFALIEAASRSPFVSTYNGTADCLYYKEPTNDGERFYESNRQEHNDPRLRPTHSLKESLREQVVCLTVIGKLEPLFELELEIKEKHGDLLEIHLFENAYSPGWYWLTVHDRRASKDQTIKRLIKSYGLGDHELVVFGDHINDIKMFKIASRAVAVSNGHPETKSHATHMIGSNEEDSVVEYIRHHHALERG